MRRRREEEAPAAEAARAETARRWREEKEQRQAERLAHEDEERTRLRSLAVERLGRKDKAELWMRTSQPKIGGRPFDICLKDFEACASLLPGRR